MKLLVYEHLSGGAADATPVGRDATSAVALQHAGRAMRDALVDDLLAIDGIELTVAGDEAAIVHAGALVYTRPERGERSVDLVARLAARQASTWVVAPETGGVLAALCAAVPPARWIGCRPDAIRTTSSKRATLAALARRGVCTPLEFVDTAETRRWVVKPDDGAGALATRVHASRADAEAEAGRLAATRDSRIPHAGEVDRMGELLIEPWVEGEPMSLVLLCRADGVELLAASRQRIGIDSGGVVSFDGVVPHALATHDRYDAPLRELAARVGATFDGLRGYVGVDLVWHARRGPVAIEVNPRVTESYIGLSSRLGRCVAAEVVAAHAAEQEAIDGG